MRKLFLSTVAATAVLSSAALAADLPARAPAVAPAPIFVGMNWSGFYVGVNAGYHWSASNNVNAVPANAATAAYWGPAIAAGATPLNYSPSNDGFTGGAQIGYNIQTGSFVYGLEADINYVDGRGTHIRNTAVAPFVAGVNSASSKVEWLGTVRARVGIAANRALLYVTGGVAYGSVGNSLTLSFPATNDFAIGSKSSVNVGWTAGAGIEYAFTNNWTVRAEYLYYDLGNNNFNTVGTGNALNRGDFRVSTSHSGHIARVGLNYLFSSPAGVVVAKY